MRSMTGYGRGKAAQAGFEVSVEISSVNRKQTEIVLNLPRGLNEFEARARDEINAHISRGRLTVSVAIHRQGKGTSATRHLDLKAAKEYYGQLATLQKALKIKEPITVDMVLRGPGVMADGDEPLDGEACWPALHKALATALKQLLRMRLKEGEVLAGDIRSRLKFLEQKTAAIQTAAPKVMERHREVLLERAKKAGLDIAPSDERLLKEIVFFADRSDISEELTRLTSHFAQAATCLKKDEPVGRTLDFIVQEMNREVNTIGSKANDLTISQLVVDCKTELEKIREQVQNIE